MRSGDVYATLDESYITSSTGRTDSFMNSESASDGDNNPAHKNIITALCHDETSSNIYFRDARCSWLASAGTTGPTQSTPCYRFTINDQERDPADPERMMLQWEKRSKDNAPAGSDAEQFVLLLIDRKARRKSRIATMTKAGFEIVVRKSSILEGLKICWELSRPVDSMSGDSGEAFESWLYTLTLTLGVWVGCQEGWLN
jgi:hypothetical protein